MGRSAGSDHCSPRAASATVGHAAIHGSAMGYPGITSAGSLTEVAECLFGECCHRWMAATGGRHDGRQGGNGFSPLPPMRKNGGASSLNGQSSGHVL